MEQNNEINRRIEAPPKDRTKTERAIGRTAVRGAKNDQEARDLGRTAVRGAKNDQRARDLGRTATRGGR